MPAQFRFEGTAWWRFIGSLTNEPSPAALLFIVGRVFYESVPVTIFLDASAGVGAILALLLQRN